jgi:hypothetical protein
LFADKVDGGRQPLGGFRVRAITRKTKAGLEGWDFQPYPQPLEKRAEG